MAPLSDEEENYVRLALLLKGVTPRAVRTYFDKTFPPTYLPSTLNTNYNTIMDLKLKRIINQAQWNLLIPRNGVPDSKTFDVTLMICLIRHLTTINPPINGFDSLPIPGETTPESDLARLKYYRNKLAHHDSNTIDSTYFHTAWTDISNAVGRLGGQTMYQKCQELNVKILDQSNQEIMLEIKQSHEEMNELRLTIDNMGNEHAEMIENIREINLSHNSLKISHNTLQAEHVEIRNDSKDPIPQNIKDQFKNEIEDWEKEDKMFVSTRASAYVMKCLKEKGCLTLTAPSGAGKSFICRHTALVLQKEGYTIVPVYAPTDIRDYYQPGKQTVFIVDNICGNFTVNQQHIEEWKQLLPVINNINADTCCKIIVSCRLQVYKDEMFNLLLPFKACECNLLSDTLCLTSIENRKIAKLYIGKNVQFIDDLSYNSVFFPLLCSLYHKDKNRNVKEFFKYHFGVYKEELDTLSQHGDEGNYKVCSLALCVLFNNQLKENWFQGKTTDEQRHIIEDACDACAINRSTPKSKLKKALDTLDRTFICKHNGMYSTVHDKLFDFLAHYFGKKMLECLIDHGDSELVRERFIWQTSPDDKTGSINFIIEISDDHLKLYLKRFIKDWSAGKVAVVFHNNNMNISSFRQQLIQYLQQLDQLQQVKLANTKDTVLPKESCESGTTPLVCTCHAGYYDMVQWMLRNAVDVDQCRDDGASGLVVASQQGHIDIVKLFLERNHVADLYRKDGVSPLLQASKNGHTEIVKLLLQRNPDIDLCNKDGFSPLLQASQNGHTDIVKLLLERNPDVDLCTKDGASPLSCASQNGHTDIVKLLLERNPDVDLCTKDGASPLAGASQNGHTEIVTLLLHRNPDINICTKDGMSPLLRASQHGHTDIVKLLLERNPDVDLCSNAGWSPLLLASQNGHTDIVKLLLERNADVNLCKNLGYSPLIKAIIHDQTDIVRLLLEKNPDPSGHTPLSTSYVNNNTSITSSPSLVQSLMKHKTEINAQTLIGGNALYFSALHGNIEITQLLLDNNADSYICIFSKQNITKIFKEFPPEILGEFKQSIFDFLVKNASLRVTEFVIKKSVDYAFDVFTGSSPLHIACFMGRINVVGCIIDYNDNINITKEDGTTPLFYACEVGHQHIVQLLLDKGADSQICRIDQKFPLDIATDNRHTSIVMTLTEHKKKKKQFSL